MCRATIEPLHRSKALTIIDMQALSATPGRLAEIEMVIRRDYVHVHHYVVIYPSIRRSVTLINFWCLHFSC